MTRSVRDFEVSRHEAAHATAAHLLGWSVTGAERFAEGSGVTNIEPRTDGDIVERGIESGIIILAGIMASPEGSGEDHAKLGDLADAGVAVGVIYDRTAELLASPAFLDLHASVTDALWAKPKLSADELAQIFAPPAAAAPPPSGGAEARSS